MRSNQVIFIIIILLSFSTARAKNQEINVDLIVEYKTMNIAGKFIKAISVNNQIPAPTLRFKEGDQVTLNVYNHLDKGTTIHWHGLLVPFQMDGVENITQKAIAPGGYFQYKFTLKQSGTYWYHAHAGLQEQDGLYGAFVIEPKILPPYQYTKDYTLVLSDWSNTKPTRILANLKKDGDYYSPNFPLQPSLAKFIRDYQKRDGNQRKKLLSNYKMMQMMRMSIYDLADVAYDAFLLNGHTQDAPWRAPVSVGDVVRLRFIGAGASTIFHVKMPGTPMQMVHVQGNDIKPYFVNDFTIAPGETYDVLVKIEKNKTYPIYAQSRDTLGAAMGVLVTQENQTLDCTDRIPFPEPEPIMMGMDHSMMNMNMNNMTNLTMGTKYQNLKSEEITNNPDKPVQEIKMALSGFMGKYIWFINGVPEYLASPIIIHPNKRYRLILTNASMMHHPMHLHGHWLILRNGHGAYDPLLHTIDVAPGATAVADFDANAHGGQWLFHCHHLYHMMSGMARVFRYANFEEQYGPYNAIMHKPSLYSSRSLDLGFGFDNDQKFSFKFLSGKDYQKIEFYTNDATIKNGEIEQADMDVFYWRSIGEFWALKGGLNYVYKPSATPYIQPGIGLEGMMPYFIDTNVRIYYRNESVKLDVDLSRDTQITNNFFVRTGFRSIFASKTVVQDEVGRGLNQLKYIIRPYYRLAPGISLFTEFEYERDYSALRQIRYNNGESVSESTWTVGVSLLF